MSQDQHRSKWTYLGQETNKDIWLILTRFCRIFPKNRWHWRSRNFRPIANSSGHWEHWKRHLSSFCKNVIHYTTRLQVDSLTNYRSIPIPRRPCLDILSNEKLEICIIMQVSLHDSECHVTLKRKIACKSVTPNEKPF